MRLTGWDLDSLMRLNDELTMLQFEREFSLENEEKLAGPDVKMPDLLRAWRHAFFDDAELSCLDEMPAVTLRPLRTSPCVMLGSVSASWLHRGRFHFQRMIGEAP
jgi:hypothetical protein